MYKYFKLDITLLTFTYSENEFYNFQWHILYFLVISIRLVPRQHITFEDRKHIKRPTHYVSLIDLYYITTSY